MVIWKVSGPEDQRLQLLKDLGKLTAMTSPAQILASSDPHDAIFKNHKPLTIKRALQRLFAPIEGVEQ
jgi:ABC-type hemin transport system ATPase subunit